MFDISSLSLSYVVDTPEGVAIKLPVAGLWSRSAAWMIDLLIRGGVYIFLAIVLSITGLFGQGILLIVIFTLEWFYPVFYEVLNNGKTPGKKIIGIKVVNTNGSQLDWGASMTRNIIRFIDMLPLVYGVGFISVLLSRHSQRIGDIVAGTIVIYDNHDNTGSLESPMFSGLNNITAYKSFITDLSLDERRAFIAFAERFDSLSVPRKEELISIISPVLKKYNISDDIKTIKQISESVINSK